MFGTCATRWLTVCVLLILGDVSRVAAQETLFSGPQVGEDLLPFSVRGVFDEDAGQELDFVTKANAEPIVLIFVHDVNRLSISLTRVVTGYTENRRKEGVYTGVVFLNDDATAMENQLKRMRHALTPNVPTGISTEGREGPGPYGLNRNVTLTILVGKAGKVTSNFAIVQPSLQVDLPKILQSIVDVAGGSVPPLSDLAGMPDMMRNPRQADEAPNLRPLLAPLIRLNATIEDVERAAQAIEKKASEDSSVRKEIARIANTILQSGKLDNYGTPKAQEYLKKWAKEFSQPQDQPKDKPNDSSHGQSKEP
jgi:hypothetical protein